MAAASIGGAGPLWVAAAQAGAQAPAGGSGLSELLGRLSVESPVWQAVIGILVIAVVSAITYLVARRLIVRTIRRVARRTKAQWDDLILEHRVFDRLAHIAPALVWFYGVRLIPALPPPVSLLVQRVSLAVIVVVAVVSASGFLTAVNEIYQRVYLEARNRPIKGYIQIVKIFLFVGAGVVVVATIMDQSPLILLSGLGALTAVLLLIFRDTILSLVASVQIASNDMIRIGDWVEMPQHNADGDVVDVALHTVKIQNWDKTITTIPTYKFIQDSFKNWRGMQIAGGRRIKRSIPLDLGTVRFLTREEIARLSRFELLRDYLEAKSRELAEYEAAGPSDTDLQPTVRQLTNVGTFRAYCLNYLRRHPKIHNGMTLLVRQLAPGPQGLPLEVYCFSSDTDWANYEGLQSDIFEHLLAILPEFGLRAFQQPSGADLHGLPLLSRNADGGSAHIAP
jgi:miniconductance mechanosensitive channel